jgi:hypothetical protein
MDKTTDLKSHEPRTPEGRAAAEVITSFGRARKNLRLYPSNNPIYAKTVEEAFRKFQAFFNLGESLEFRIQRNELMLGEEVVFSGAGKDENLALMFFRDGLRSLTFNKGLNMEELMSFLQVLSVDFDSESVEEDMVTLLWERDFVNIRYRVDESMLVQEDSIQASAEEKAKATVTDEQGLMQAHDSVLKEEEVKELIPMPITEKDLAQLAKDIVSNDEDRMHKLIDILFDMLYAAENMDEFKDAISVMKTAVEYSVRNNNFPGALNIFRRVNDIMQKAKADNVKTALLEVLEYAGSYSMVKVVSVQLDTKEGIPEEEFKEYASFLTSKAMPNLITMLGELKTTHGRKLAIGALTEVGRKDIAALAKFLKDPRWFVVRNILLIMRETGDKRALDHMVQAVDHEDPRVRKEAVRGIGDLGGHKHVERLIEALYDPDHAVSLTAVFALGKLKTLVARDAIVARLLDKKFQDEDSETIRRYFEALAHFKYEDVIEFIDDVVRKNPFFGRSAYNEFKSAAIYCLGIMGNPKAISLLEELAESKVKQVSDAANTAIKRIKYAATKR